MAESKHPDSARGYHLVGKHSVICVRQKHEDWQHGLTGCAVGRDPTHCECKVRWVEDSPDTRFGE
jgi:hypothetical protein